MKRQTAKDILAESFRELAAVRPVDRITIEDIVGNCSYSHATFYRHFRDKYDLMAWDYAQKAAAVTERAKERIRAGGGGMKEIFLGAVGMFEEHGSPISNTSQLSATPVMCDFRQLDPMDVL